MQKESHPLDDFFKESLKDLKVAPSATARSRFLEEAKYIGGKTGLGFWRWFSLLTMAGLLTTAVLLYLYSPSPNHPAPVQDKTAVAVNSQSISPSSAKPVVHTAVLKAEAITKNSILTTSPEVKVQAGSPTQSNAGKPIARPVQFNSSLEPKTAKIKDKKADTLKTTSSPVKTESQEPSAVLASNDAPPALSTRESSVSRAEDDKKLLLNEETGKISIPADPGKNLAGNTIPAQSEEAASASEPTPTGKSGQEPASNVNTAKSQEGKSKPDSKLPQGNWEFTPYVKYSYDWQFRKNNEQGENALGLEGKIQKGRFSVRLGAAISTTSGSSNCQVLYNDYLGRFKKLDSISFAWDENHYHLVPSYHTSESNVWDSTVKTDYYKISNTYRLIRVPLVIGYNFIQRDKFSLGLNTGVAMSFCLDKKKVSGEYSAGQNRLIAIKQEDDEYARNNFYLIGDLTASYAITRRLYLDLEPHFNYLLNPSGSQSSKLDELLVPGIRASLKFKF